MLERILQLDQTITLFFNGSDSVYMDRLMMAITSTITWIPLACVLIYVLYKNNSLKQFILILLMIALCIFLADRFASGFCKPFFQRFRPSQDPSLKGVIDLVNGYTGGLYGFFSSHAANTFSVFTFLALLFKKRSFTYILLSWPILNIWSRVYLGVHYFGDVMVGTLWGVMVGYFVYFLFTKTNKLKFFADNNSDLNSSNYLLKDVSLIIYGLFITYLVILLKSFFI